RRLSMPPFFRSRKSLRAPRVRLAVERLEARDVPATFTVTNLNDAGPGSLRLAIESANAGTDPAAIVFQPGLTGTLTLTSGQLDVINPVTVTGPGSGKLTISGNDASRIFRVNNNSMVQDFALSGLTLTKGKAAAGGGIFLGNDNLVLGDVVITG